MGFQFGLFLEEQVQTGQQADCCENYAFQKKGTTYSFGLPKNIFMCV